MTCHSVREDTRQRELAEEKKGKVAKYGAQSIPEDTSERESHDEDDVLRHSESYAFAPKIAEL